MQAAEDPEPAAEREAADADRRAAARVERAALRVEGVVDPAERRAAADRPRARRRGGCRRAPRGRSAARRSSSVPAKQCPPPRTATASPASRARASAAATSAAEAHRATVAGRTCRNRASASAMRGIVPHGYRLKPPETSIVCPVIHAHSSESERGDDLPDVIAVAEAAERRALRRAGRRPRGALGEQLVGDHPGAGRPRGDRVDADPARAELLRQVACEHHDPALHRRVGRVADVDAACAAPSRWWC